MRLAALSRPSSARPLRRLWPALAVLAGSAGLALPAAAGAETPAQLRALEAAGVREIIVRRDAGLDARERAAVRAAVDGTLVERLSLPDVDVLRVPAGSLDEAVAELSAHPDVRWAEANSPVRASAADPLYQWGLANDGRSIGHTPGVADADIDAPEAWLQTTGAGATVAVVDSGVDSAHPELAGRIAVNPGESGDGRESNGIDDDHNGFVDDVHGWDWVAGDAAPEDENGHGTHVAGTVAATRGNGLGGSGVAPDAAVLSLRVLDAQGGGWDSDVAEAFDYAGELGIPVVTASLGGPGTSWAERDAIRRHPGTLYVVAAGNESLDLDGSAYAPCTIPEPNVLCVGASDHRDALAGFSNHGSTEVDLVAPGSAITSLAVGGGYRSMSGTSMATPHVAGVAALVRALRPGDAATAVREAILAGAERRPGLDGYAVTGARLNAAGALDAAGGGPGAPAPEPAPEPVPVVQPPAPAPSVTPAPAPAPAVPAPGTPPGTPATERDPVSRPASPFASLRVAVRRRAVTVRLGLSRRATVRLTLHRGRAVSARSRRLAAGTSTVALGRLPRGTYRLRASAGADAIERRFTVR